jgi:thiosulfate reductase cytochrome b subunit
VTYLVLLNVLLPAQVISGLLIWGRGYAPDWVNEVGGLPLLAAFHSLISWLMASFIVLHVYMTTTGHEPLTNIRAMMYGWDEVEDAASDHPTQVSD